MNQIFGLMNCLNLVWLLLACAAPSSKTRFTEAPLSYHKYGKMFVDGKLRVDSIFYGKTALYPSFTDKKIYYGDFSWTISGPLKDNTKQNSTKIEDYRIADLSKAGQAGIASGEEAVKQAITKYQGKLVIDRKTGFISGDGSTANMAFHEGVYLIKATHLKTGAKFFTHLLVAENKLFLKYKGEEGFAFNGKILANVNLADMPGGALTPDIFGIAAGSGASAAQGFGNYRFTDAAGPEVGSQKTIGRIKANNNDRIIAKIIKKGAKIIKQWDSLTLDNTNGRIRGDGTTEKLPVGRYIIVATKGTGKDTAKVIGAIWVIGDKVTLSYDTSGPQFVANRLKYNASGLGLEPTLPKGIYADEYTWSLASPGLFATQNKTDNASKTTRLHLNTATGKLSTSSAARLQTGSQYTIVATPKPNSASDTVKASGRLTAQIRVKR